MTFSNHLLLHVLSDHLDFLLTIDQDFLQLYRWFHVESFQLWDLTSPFSDMNFNMEYLVSTTLFNSYFWWLVCIFISQNLCCSLDCCISVLLLVLLGSGWSWVWSFKVFIFFLKWKIYNCIFFQSTAFLKLIPCFLKVPQLTENLLLENENGEFLRIYLLKHYQVIQILFEQICWSFEKLYFLQESVLVR